MTDVQSAFIRGDAIVVDIKAEHPDRVICEATIVYPDPNVSGTIGPLEKE